MPLRSLPRRSDLSLFLALLVAPFLNGLLPAQCPAPLHVRDGTTSLSAADGDALHAALDAYDAGNASAAEPQLLRLTKTYPSNYPAAEALGSLYVESNRLALALPLLQRAASLAPREPLAQANLGAALLASNQLPAALCALRRAVDLSPPEARPVAEANLAHALLLDNQPAAAARAFAQAAAALSAPDPDLLYNWSLALLRSGSAAQADQVLDRIPTASRGDQTLALAADIDERLGRYQAALAHLQAAAQANPSEANLYALTLELLRHWTWDAAEEVAHFGATRYPTSAHFRVAEAIAYYAAGDFKGAIPLLAAQLADQPEDSTVADLLGRSCSLLAEGEELGCRAVYTYAMVHPGNAVMTTYAAAAILHQPQATQNLPEAEKLLHAALADDARYAPAWFQLGVLHGIQLQWQQSATDLEHAVTLQPTLAEAHYRLSRAYAHLGQREAAAAQLALQQSYAKEAKTTLDARLDEVVTFLLKPTPTQSVSQTTGQVSGAAPLASQAGPR